MSNKFVARKGLIALQDSEITGSLSVTGITSGSFIGDGSGLTGLINSTTASYVDFSNIDNLPTLISGSSQISYNGITDVPSGIVSGSSQIASDISGSFTAVSASLASDISTNDSRLSTLEGKTLVSGSSQIASDISGSFTSVSASLASDISTNDSRLSTLEGKTLVSGSSQINHDSTTGFVSNEHIDHSTVSITAGSGLTGGGDITTSRTINIGSGTGVTVGADSISIGQDVATTADVTFGSLAVTNNVTISGNLTVLGDATELQVSSLNVEDINITIASGAADSAAANGAGITIAGANESLTWDHGNSRFNFSDDLNVTGNITLTGTVDGRDVATDGSKLDGIDAGANNYTHPTHPGDDFSVDSGPLTGATVISDIDINVTTDTLGHVTDANGSIATRTLTLGDLGYTGATDANNYVHPTHAGDDINIDTGALTGATVISDLDFNVTTDTLGHVTDANGSIATRTLTLGDLGYTGATNADNYSSWTIRDGDTTTYTITSGDTLQIASGTGITSNFTADDVLTITNTGVLSVNGNTGAVTSTNLLDAIKTVDGAGSGLDADTLDTYHASSFVLKNTSYEWTSGVLTFRSADVLEVSTGDQATLEVYQDTSGADAFMQFHISGDYAAYFGLKGDINDFAVGGWSMGNTYYRVWHAGNDGAGSGLDADTLDGVQGSSFLRSNATDTASGVITFSNSTASTSTTTGAVKVTGGVGIGGQLNVGGDVVAYSSSDKRLKDNILPIQNPTEKLKKISGYEFDWNTNQEYHTGHDIGVIAQEIEEILPEIVTTRDNGYKAVKYEKLVALLIESNKELLKRVEELESKLK